ncbi:tetratricopeptide repeat protein [Asticcacaulis sp. EMRT-3]|uniref:tetratricopeptide repeat protein n=1 Tax=Asticcacaulis sp. EMRT-3 TaxID=3040349 RepID=UPI0024AEEEC6|nr:tetratricopeptide repeat protein [Asticcacaulis sp. EMRT-3]MDI7774235.1 tetratricopeptide repeat protein [Asticcacaulis sp. EMRT-3]
MPKPRLVPALAGLLSLACATAVPASAHSTAPVTEAAQSPIADFLVGRYAIANGDIATAAQAMNAAAQADPASSDLRESAFLVGILGGDIDRAAAMAPGLKDGSDTSRLMGPLVMAVTEIRAGRYGAARRHIEAGLKFKPQDRNLVLLRPYVLALDGKWKQAFDESGDAALTASDSGRLLVYLLKSERARLYELHGDNTSAEVLYKALCQPGAASYIFGPDYAAFLERQGRGDEAKALWSTIASQSGDPAAKAALKRIAKGGAAPALPDLKASMAQALFVSSTIAFSEHDSEMALASIRLSLYLDPQPERPRIFLGQIEQNLKDTQAADAVWAGIGRDSPFYAEATLRRAGMLRDAGDSDGALALLDQALSIDPDNLSLISEKAGLLHAEYKDQAALDVIEARVKRAGDKDFTWQAWFLEAMIYDSLDRWSDAEAMITKAQALNPGRPEILNFLGYGWIEHGIHIQDGMDLVRQAMNISPKSGAIIDSLGWGYYKLGDYDQALTYIEQAIQLEPADADINEHLGDVYKALGRNTEAGYEWQRVLTLKTSDKQAAEVRKKIDDNAASLRMVSGAVAPKAGAVKVVATANDPAARQRP